MGHSFGGRVALELSSKFGDLVKGLVLIDSAGLKPRRTPLYYIKITIHKLLRKLGFKGLKGSDDYRVLSLIMKETFKKVVSYDQSFLLKDISVPTAIFWGKRDQDTPPYMARKLNAGIKDSQIFWLDGGHYSYVDDYEKFLAVLKAYINEVSK